MRFYIMAILEGIVFFLFLVGFIALLVVLP